MKKIWSLGQPAQDLAGELEQNIGIPSAVADIMVQRGIKSSQEAVDFLCPSLMNLASPFAFVQMPKAVERLVAARQNGDKVLVYGDYDVDGVTSTTLLFKVLKALDFQAVVYIPNRQEEGYGLNKDAIEKAFQAQVKVLVTVDCGIASVEEIRMANELGIDVIITDHHEPPLELPPALALINPKLPDSGYPFFHLAGVGVAFKLAQALLARLGEQEKIVTLEQEILDLVALGTIADIVPLVGENRIMVAKGLAQMENTRHLGLEALLAECGLQGKPLTAGQIGFVIAPRINAAGRMNTARVGLELLLTDDWAKAESLAKELSQENLLRRQTEQDILAEAIDILEKGPIPRVIVLSAPHWHHGVIGIVASRLVERYYRPVFMIAEDGEESKGSARGIRNYHVLEQMSLQGDLLTKYGGHRQAAGFSLPTQNIPFFRERLNEAVAEWPEELFWEVLPLDRQINLEEASPQLLHFLQQLAPFGFGNPNPLLAGRDFPVYSMRTVGKEGDHLSLRLGNRGEKNAIAFRRGELLTELERSATLDVAFSLEANHYQGKEEVQLVLKDLETAAFWEVAAAAGEPACKGIEWLDWRNKSAPEWREEVLKIGSEQNNILLWDPEGRSADRLKIGLKFDEHIKYLAGTLEEITLWGKDEFSLGIVVSWPLTLAELRRGIREFYNLGISHIALVGEIIEPEELRRNCRYQSREELENAYRYLRQLAAPGKYFWWTRYFSGLKEGLDQVRWLHALTLFEELGLISCLGGTEQMLFKWIPPQNKLDLEQAAHYRLGKKLWQEAQLLQENLANQSMAELSKILI